jgi:hypothetical protein
MRHSLPRKELPLSPEPSAAFVVDRIVSAAAWVRFPGLLSAVERWSKLAGDEVAGCVVSAVVISIDYISVRVTFASDRKAEPDWLEWLAPTGFSTADQVAIDHFAARSLHGAFMALRARSGTGRKGEPYAPLQFDPTGEASMPRAKPEPMPPAKPARPATRKAAAAKPDPGRGVPATPLKKPRRKPARKPATANATAAMSVTNQPRSAPVGKPARKTTRASTSGASASASASARPKAKAKAPEPAPSAMPAPKRKRAKPKPRTKRG